MFELDARQDARDYRACQAYREFFGDRARVIVCPTDPEIEPVIVREEVDEGARSFQQAPRFGLARRRSAILAER